MLLRDPGSRFLPCPRSLQPVIVARDMGKATNACRPLWQVTSKPQTCSVACICVPPAQKPRSFLLARPSRELCRHNDAELVPQSSAAAYQSWGLSKRDTSPFGLPADIGRQNPRNASCLDPVGDLGQPACSGRIWLGHRYGRAVETPISMAFDGCKLDRREIRVVLSQERAEPGQLSSYHVSIPC
jgi:hypothetical protein